jgi:hypothetical protein
VAGPEETVVKGTFALSSWELHLIADVILLVAGWVDEVKGMIAGQHSAPFVFVKVKGARQPASW